MTSNIKTALQLARAALWKALVSDKKEESKLAEPVQRRIFNAHAFVDEVLEDIGDRDIPYPDDMPDDDDDDSGGG